MILSSTGTIVSAKSHLHGTYAATIHAITTSWDSFIYLTGSLASEMVIIKMTNSGNLEWVKYYSYDTLLMGYSICRAFSGNGVIVTGKSSTSSGSTIVVMEVDYSGELSYQNPYTAHPTTLTSTDISSSLVHSSLSWSSSNVLPLTFSTSVDSNSNPAYTPSIN